MTHKKGSDNLKMCTNRKAVCANHSSKRENADLKTYTEYNVDYGHCSFTYLCNTHIVHDRIHNVTDCSFCC